MRSVDIEAWRGPRDEVVIDPATVVFRVVPASRKQCVGCMFDRQASSVCKAAAARAVAVGLPDCDDGFIYAEPDPRQIDCASERL